MKLTMIQNQLSKSSSSLFGLRPSSLQQQQHHHHHRQAPRRAAAAQGRRQQRCLAVLGTTQEPKRADTEGAGAEAEYYEVYLDKPLGIKFARGVKDGGAYILKSDPALGNTSPDITPGDKIVKVSASFGDDTWDAFNYGQTVYAIKTRNGQVYLKLKKNYGDMSALDADDLTEAERKFLSERNGGNYGMGTKEVQARNYAARQEAEKNRRSLFDAALAKFKAGKIEEALIDFENVLALEPPKYLGDDFSRVTRIYQVTQYNVACCYSTLKQVENGLEALEAALDAGFDDYEKVRSDPNLAALRAEKERFNAVIDKYDEPIINEAAVKAIQSFFSFGKK